MKLFVFLIIMFLSMFIPGMMTYLYYVKKEKGDSLLIPPELYGMLAAVIGLFLFGIVEFLVLAIPKLLSL